MKGRVLLDFSHAIKNSKRRHLFSLNLSVPFLAD